MIKRLSIFVLITLMLVGASGVTIDAQPDVPQQTIANTNDSQSIAIVASNAQQQAALARWTPQARAAAQPAPMPEVSPDDIALLEQDIAADLAPGYAAGGTPDPRADLMARMQYPGEWFDFDEAGDLNELALNPEGTSEVYTRYLVNKYNKMHKPYPYRTIGKLFYDGGWCSASVISDNNIIVTAGHCLYDNDDDAWYTDWVFVPANRKNDSKAPYGTFPWESARILTDYANCDGVANCARWDVGVITLGNNSAGNSVTYYTGWLGRSWNYGYIQHHHNIAYPSNIDSGKWTYACVAESSQEGTDVLEMGCDMTYGASGGPWIRVFQPYASGAMNYVNAVNSYINTSGIENIWGPRFSSDNIVILCDAEGC